MKEMNISARGYRAMNDADAMNGVGIGLNSNTLLIIKLPDWRTLRVISRSLFLAMLLLALPSIGSIMRTSSNWPLYDPDSNLGFNDGFKILPFLLRDLLDEGLIKKGHKGFVLGAGMHGVDGDFEFLRDAGVDLVAGADLRQKMVNDQQVFDFMFAPSFHGIHLVDGVLKDNGLIISPLRVDLSDELKVLRNFKIVYLRRFENTMIALRKSEAPVVNAAAKRVLCGASPEEKKKAALKELEDVFLEPPRRTTLAKTSSFTSRKIKFLPDLLEDSLDEYSRRIFISDDSGALDWFYKNYPMRDQQFEVYNMDVVDEDHQENGVSRWIMENVRREDYVVMKAEAQVVEEMLRDKTVCLVDELFLECKNQWQDGEEQSRSKRAYWECLALYGKVKDEGIAVHQWWY